MQQSPCSPKASSPEAVAAKPRGARKSPKALTSMTRLALDAQSREARQVAAAVLEVLAGARTPTDAAGALGVSLPRYYAIEARALEGLIKACERRARGPRRNPERELGALRRELERVQREGARYQALLRASQRAVGLRPPESLPTTKAAGGKKKKRRQAVARALKASGLLRASSEVALESPLEGGEHPGGAKA